MAKRDTQLKEAEAMETSALQKRVFNYAASIAVVTCSVVGNCPVSNLE